MSIRIDMRSPRAGATLFYPDQQGKVVLNPGGWASVFTLHLAPDSALLGMDTGQRIDQTDMGLLIRNIGRSLTIQRRGECRLGGSSGKMQLEVLAEDHFLPGVETLYRFVIDTADWLPREVHEFSPDGTPKRTVHFRTLQPAVTFADNFFQPNSRE
jgi:hypothetical protein